MRVMGEKVLQGGRRCSGRAISLRGLPEQRTTGYVAQATEAYCPTVLEARSLWEEPALVTPGCEGESVPCLSPRFWWLAVIPGVPWLVEASPRSLPPS